MDGRTSRNSRISCVRADLVRFLPSLQKWKKPRKTAGNDGTDDEESSSSGDSSGDSSEEEEQGNNGGGEEEGEDEEEDEEDESSEDSSESSGSEDEDGTPKKPKKGLLGLGDRLAARAAAIAKTAGNALQAVTGEGRRRETPPWARAACFRRCNCNHGVPTDSTAFVPLQEGRKLEHEAVGVVTVRTEPLEGAELEFENRPPLERTPPPPYVLRLFLEYMDSRTVARCAHTSKEWHRECYQRNEEGVPMHPAYIGMHFMELGSQVDACQDKIDGMFFHQPPTGSPGQLFTAGQRRVTAWRRQETEVDTEREQSTASEGSGSTKSGESSETSHSEGDAAPRIEVSWQSAGVCLRDTAPFTMILPVNSRPRKNPNMAFHSANTSSCFLAWQAFTAPSVGFCKAHGAPQHSCYMYSVSDDRYLKVWDLATKDCLHTVKPKISDCGTVWNVPKASFGHTKVCTFREHKRAITALSLTKAHLFSASDEGHVVRQDRRIKCIWVHHAPPDSPDPGNGSLFLGLATGLVLAYPITDAV
ncbi:hypothetical protein Esi_0004_0251 [Ectocarpus siliculosus]|uniref:F-box domain-containing protein n=1 Tax=Ectocarpus siliculosus TaxID=2880 RepID=D8LMJ5_ECTSI|nr:hypothetical protein Esi_0004_0251 [Ectocarpus siliculosus]|eukprot:CBN77605.1 hypothetical protein Esi_0004_0251 [Ectocarpus siliculosus]